MYMLLAYHRSSGGSGREVRYAGQRPGRDFNDQPYRSSRFVPCYVFRAGAWMVSAWPSCWIHRIGNRSDSSSGNLSDVPEPDCAAIVVQPKSIGGKDGN